MWNSCILRMWRGTWMKFENTDMETIKIDLNRLDEVMFNHSMVRSGQWDYERVTYDHKFQIKEGIYYLRIQGYAFEGDVGNHDATIQLLTPLLGKYYYPHGIEYGEDEHFPSHLVKKCEGMIANIKKDLVVFSE